MVAPLLELTRARVDVAGIPAVDDLSLASTSRSLVLLGGPNVLFEALSGMRTPSHGEVRVRGAAAHAAARDGALAGAPLDPPLPPRWTLRQYATWSARLAGNSKREAVALAADAIAQLKLGAFADQKLAQAPTHVRRAGVVAAALATGAQTLVLEDPAVSLPDDAGRNLARAILRAVGERSWIVCASRLQLESPFALDAEEAIVVAPDHVVAQGAPAEIAAREHAYSVRVVGRADLFRELAAQAGARVAGEGGALLVDLGENLAVSDILRMAADAQATVVELRPLSHAFT